jgi:hypothetical protein
MNMQFKLTIVPLLLSGYYDLTIVSIMVSTVSLLFRNAYVQRCVYIIYIESKVARHTAAHVPIPLNGGFFNDHFDFRHSHKFCLWL